MNTKQAGIYLITSKINGKRYIGSSVRICNRWKVHISNLRLNKHPNQHLQRHFNKYGEQDLIFTVLEVIERGELSLNDFKQLLLDREQAYLDNWNECQFNCLPTAGSSLGVKRKGAKYYIYNKRDNNYATHYSVAGKHTKFSCHYTEEEAIKEVEYLKTLTEDELIKYKEECLARPYKQHRGTKNYYFHKQSGRYIVKFYINGKNKHFGSYETEQEAIDRVTEVRKELGIS
jgi:group I intron endonuclease